jgi:uncharacterized cupredoxin-like copper-binding protein
MKRTLTAATLALAAAATAGCSSLLAGMQEGDADPASADVTIVAEDVAFVDPPTELPAGDLVLAIDNQGSAVHDVTIDGPGVIASAFGGRKNAGEVTLEPGTYTIYCSVNGHRQAGMEFDVTVG